LGATAKVERENGKGEMVKGGMGKGMDSALWCLLGPALRRPAGRRIELVRVRGSFLRSSRQVVRSLLFLEKRSEQWVVELVTPASNANQQTRFGQSAEVLALEFVVEFMDCKSLWF
jgi:hypothetical protein